VVVRRPSLPAVRLLLAVLPQRRMPPRRRRLRVRRIVEVLSWAVTNCFAEKEESDEDMGFGLFD
jgi:hypothetical protein